MVDINKISTEVIQEMESKLNFLPPFPNEHVSAASIKKAIIAISTEVCSKMLEKYHQDK